MYSSCSPAMETLSLPPSYVPPLKPPTVSFLHLPPPPTAAAAGPAGSAPTAGSNLPLVSSPWPHPQRKPPHPLHGQLSGPQTGFPTSVLSTQISSLQMTLFTSLACLNLAQIPIELSINANLLLRPRPWALTCCPNFTCAKPPMVVRGLWSLELFLPCHLWPLHSLWNAFPSAEHVAGSSSGGVSAEASSGRASLPHIVPQWTVPLSLSPHLFLPPPLTSPYLLSLLLSLLPFLLSIYPKLHMLFGHLFI